MSSTAQVAMANANAPIELKALNETLGHAAESTTRDESSDSDPDVKTGDDGAHAPPPVPPRRYHGLMPRPNCTHIVMDYYFTDHVLCDSCGQPPRLGWLYLCQQDQYSEAAAKLQIESLKQTDEHVPTRIQELQACGMSRSVVDQVKQGNVYDPFQIEVLRNQKMNMLRVMDQHLSREHEPWNASANQMINVLINKPLPEEPVSENVTIRSGSRLARAATAKIVQRLGHYRRRSQVIPKCGFKCCHACRPYLRDRAYVSLNAIAQDKAIPEKFVLSATPVSKLKHVVKLGLRPTHQHRFLTSQESLDETSSDTSISCSSDSDASVSYMDSIYDTSTPETFNHEHTPLPLGAQHVNQGPTPSQRSPPYSDRLRGRAMPPSLYDASASTEGRVCPSLQNGSKMADQVVKRLSHQAPSHFCYDPGSLTRNEEHPETADIGLQTSADQMRVTSGADNSTERGRPLTRERFYSGRDQSGGHSTPRSQVSHGTVSGEEVPVQGGLAVTEEALEMRVPDIITQI